MNMATQEPKSKNIQSDCSIADHMQFNILALSQKTPRNFVKGPVQPQNARCADLETVLNLPHLMVRWLLFQYGTLSCH